MKLSMSDICTVIRCCKAPLFQRGYICIITHHAFRYLAATPLGKFLALNSTPFTPLISAFTLATASISPLFPGLPPECVGFAYGSFSRYARSSLMLSPSGFVDSPFVGRRSDSLLWIPESALVWFRVGDGPSSGSEEAEDIVRERRGEVCVPAERLKKRAPSEVVESESESSSFERDGISGTFETARSSLPFKASRFAPALSNSEWRANVKLSTMGSTTYLLVP